MLNGVECPEQPLVHMWSKQNMKKYKKFVYKMESHQMFDTGARVWLHAHIHFVLARKHTWASYE